MKALTAGLKHFVAYHDRNKWKAYPKARLGAAAYHWTKKNYREETLAGNRVWVIEGTDSPEGKRYGLRSTGLISHVTPASSPYPPGRFVYFRVESNPQENDPTELPWFQSLLKKTQRFRFGLSPVRDPRIIAGLEMMTKGE